jgi:hypothetical protein
MKQQLCSICRGKRKKKKKRKQNLLKKQRYDSKVEFRRN